jgi:hypothetical protein
MTDEGGLCEIHPPHVTAVVADKLAYLRGCGGVADWRTLHWAAGSSPAVMI